MLREKMDLRIGTFISFVTVDFARWLILPCFIAGARENVALISCLKMLELVTHALLLLIDMAVVLNEVCTL